ncbi:MAG: hypothetical protein KF868_06240 [Acidobacteria bacterium]|nr:hypothetical protein [Acidobacteriota bacterium]MCW5970977.1 hypothetical protein [Blastocatellales bacterium]
MQADIQEIFATTIRPLSKDEKLRLATLILEEVTGQAPGNGAPALGAPSRKLSELFGAASLGAAGGLDNDRIDADLAREYGRGLDKDD